MTKPLRLGELKIEGWMDKMNLNELLPIAEDDDCCRNEWHYRSGWNNCLALINTIPVERVLEAVGRGVK